MVYERLAQSRPERPERPPSTWGRRVGAGVIDYALGTSPFALLYAKYVSPAVISAGGMFDPAGVRAGRAAWKNFAGVDFYPSFLLGRCLVLAIYLIVLHALFGQTLGKRITGTKVVKTDGSRCDLRAASLRALVYPLGSVLPLVGGFALFVNGLSPLFDWDRRSLGDRLGRTKVVLRSESRA